MKDQTRDDHDDDPTSEEPGRSTAWFVAVPAIAFLLGAVLGGLVIGVGGGSSDDDGTAGGDPSAAAPTSTGPSTAVVVPDSCLEAADSVRRATELIREGVGAIQEFRVDPILDLLDQLEDLDGLAREQASSCTGTRVTDAGEPAESPTEPTQSPSSTPTPTPGG